MPRPRAPTPALVLMLVILSLLAGCSRTDVAGSKRTLHIALNEYRLNPASARVLAGVLTIYVRNFGRLTHNLVISQSRQTIAATEPVRPGQSAVLAVNLAPGTYSMASTILSDASLGESGTLEVTP